MMKHQHRFNVINVLLLSLSLILQFPQHNAIDSSSSSLSSSLRKLSTNNNEAGGTFTSAETSTLRMLWGFGFGGGSSEQEGEEYGGNTTTTAPTEFPSSYSTFTDDEGEDGETEEPSSAPTNTEQDDTNTSISTSPSTSQSSSPSISSSISPSTSPTQQPSLRPSLTLSSPPSSTPSSAPSKHLSFMDKEKIKAEAGEEDFIEIVHDPVARSMAAIFAFLSIFGMLFTAQQLLERPDGLCANCCRLSLKLATIFMKLCCMPCSLICGYKPNGYTGTDQTNRAVFLQAEEYTDDLELT